MVSPRGIGIEDLLLPVGAFAEDVRILIDGLLTHIHIHLVYDEGILGGVQHIELLPRIGNAEGSVIADGGIAFAAVPGRDEDDSVRAVGSVDRGLVRVLEDGYALDVGRIDVVYASCHRHSVHYVERIGIVDGAYAANPYLGWSARLAGRRGDGDT